MTHATDIYFTFNDSENNQIILERLHSPLRRISIGVRALGGMIKSFTSIVDTAHKPICYLKTSRFLGDISADAI